MHAGQSRIPERAEQAAYQERQRSRARRGHPDVAGIRTGGQKTPLNWKKQSSRAQWRTGDTSEEPKLNLDILAASHVDEIEEEGAATDSRFMLYVFL